MEQNIQNNAKNEQVILQLPGIDKKWVRHNGKWVDQNSLPAIKSESVEANEGHSLSDRQVHNPWWKFWTSNA